MNVQVERKGRQDKDYVRLDWNMAARGLALNLSTKWKVNNMLFCRIVILFEGVVDGGSGSWMGFKISPHLTFWKMLQQVWLELVISLGNDVISRHLIQLMNRSLCHTSSNQTNNHDWPPKRSHLIKMILNLICGTHVQTCCPPNFFLSISICSGSSFWNKGLIWRGKIKCNKNQM